MMFSRGEHRVLHLGWDLGWACVWGPMAGCNSPAAKDLGVRLDTLTVNQQYALAVMRANCNVC